MKFKTKDLQELAYGEDIEGFESILKEIVAIERWEILYYQVFKYGDKFYCTNYRVGATESQERGPYDFESKSGLECKEVWPVEKTVTEYVLEEPKTI